ncbi:MAG: hypothetical protein LAO03_04605 [Acidobacteriia bacterium]|nr:hypothetical protein [Terriglobia bacterium]
MTTTALLVAGDALLHWHRVQYFRVLTLLMIAVVASRFKLKLPGLNSNMSVNLPFILIATVQLSLFEALIVGLASTLVQCFPKDRSKLQPLQLLFNLSTMAVAVGIGNLVFQQRGAGGANWASSSLLLVLVATGFFCAQTIPVAAVISLTEGGKLIRIWSTIFHLSFPYYVLSAGVTSIVATASAHVGWPIPVLALPVMYATHLSYRLYFRSAVSLEKTQALAKSASACG